MCTGQNRTGNQVVSSSGFEISFTPLHSGMLHLEANLTAANGAPYPARAFLQVLPGVADPEQTLVLGPGSVGGQASQPLSFYTQVRDARGDPTVSPILRLISKGKP